MKILTFDVESTGLFGREHTWEKDFMSYPYIASIAWRVSDADNNLLIEHNHFVRPDGWSMPAGAAAVNGLSDEILNKKGGDLKTILRHFISDAMQADRLVAHNMNYDSQVVKANLLRLGIKKEAFNDSLDKSKRYCTMLKSIPLVNGSSGGNKWPKLMETYQYLFNEQFDGAHDALADVRACSRIYYELIKRNIC